MTNGEKTTGGDDTEYKDGSSFYPMHLMAPTIMQTDTGIKNQYRQLYVKH